MLSMKFSAGFTSRSSRTLTIEVALLTLKSQLSISTPLSYDLVFIYEVRQQEVFEKMNVLSSNGLDIQLEAS